MHYRDRLVQRVHRPAGRRKLDRRYDHVVFDTAPTGHTIRLLQLPGSWTDFLAAGKGDASCLGPLSGLDKQKAVYARAVGALKDPAQTRMVLVGRPQASALAEIERTSGELAQIGITGQYVVINAVLPQTAGEDDLTRSVRAREASALAAIRPRSPACRATCCPSRRRT